MSVACTTPTADASMISTQDDLEQSSAMEPPHIDAIKPVTMSDSIQSLLDISSPGRYMGQSKAKSTSSVVHHAPGKPSQSTFGSRLLTDATKVDDFNAWDHVEWDEAHLSKAAERISFHAANPVPRDDQEQYGDAVANTHWNRFYSTHEEGFFKDRKWINLEFPELIACTAEMTGPKIVADLGCAVGNTVFPLLRSNKNLKLIVHALDFSSEAIEIVKSNPEYNSSIIKAGVWDIADPEGLPSSVAPESVDVVVLIFAFSALSPTQWPIAMRNLKAMLKPEGLLLLRDYGRYDLTQLRLKANRLLSESFYIRGDGTRVYYFTNEELAGLFSVEEGWSLEQNAIDKRLLVNRKEGKKMYRAWVQIKARKI